MIYRTGHVCTTTATTVKRSKADEEREPRRTDLARYIYIHDSKNNDNYTVVTIRRTESQAEDTHTHVSHLVL
jgi:hypothetical protein